eukprot:scaffold343_cov245-Pinguiococcus_pyrenoidosus.AAC.22
MVLIDDAGQRLAALHVLLPQGVNRISDSLHAVLVLRQGLRDAVLERLHLPKHVVAELRVLFPPLLLALGHAAPQPGELVGDRAASDLPAPIVRAESLIGLRLRLRLRLRLGFRGEGPQRRGALHVLLRRQQRRRVVVFPARHVVLAVGHGVRRPGARGPARGLGGIEGLLERGRLRVRVVVVVVLRHGYAVPPPPNTPRWRWGWAPGPERASGVSRRELRRLWHVKRFGLSTNHGAGFEFSNLRGGPRLETVSPAVPPRPLVRRHDVGLWLRHLRGVPEEVRGRAEAGRGAGGGVGEADLQRWQGAAGVGCGRCGRAGPMEHRHCVRVQRGEAAAVGGHSGCAEPAVERRDSGGAQGTAPAGERGRIAGLTGAVPGAAAGQRGQGQLDHCFRRPGQGSAGGARGFGPPTQQHAAAAAGPGVRSLGPGGNICGLPGPTRETGAPPGHARERPARRRSREARAGADAEGLDHAGYVAESDRGPSAERAGGARLCRGSPRGGPANDFADP